MVERIAYSALLPMPGCSTAETLETQLVSEEYELDLGINYLRSSGDRASAFTKSDRSINRKSTKSNGR